MRPLFFLLTFLTLTISLSCNQKGRNSFEKGAHVHLKGDDFGKPIGLFFIENEYHLFYEKSENERTVSPGHLKSKNLLAWDEIASTNELETDENLQATCIVQDWNNSFELLDSYEPILAYILKNNSVSIQYTNDVGKSWQSFQNRTVILDTELSNANDLKIVWHDDSQKWLLLLLKDFQIEFYASTDLLNWEYQSEFDNEPAVKKGEWTGVQFFPLEQNETFEVKWCLCISANGGAPNGGSGTQYFVGDFDGFQFITEDDVKWMDNGTDFHTPVVLSDYLLLNKEPVSIGKIDESKSFTLARSLSLTRKFNEFFVTTSPIGELNQLHHITKQIAGQEFKGELTIKKTQKLPLEMELTFDLNNRKYLDFAEVFGIILENENKEKLIVGYHNLRRYFFISFNGEIVYAPGIIDQKEVDIKLIIDNSSVELFAMDGLISMTKKYNSEKILKQLKLFAEGGKITLKEASISELSSVKI